MKSNLHPDSRNVNNPRTEGLLKGHKSTKLPSPTGQANGTKSSEEDRLREELASSGIKILSLKSRSPCSNLRVVKLNNVNVNDRINFKDIDLEPIKRIPYDELALATQNFADCNVLGKGGFGTVYRGSWKDVVVAVKKLQLYTRRQVSTASAHPGVPAKLVEKEEKRRAEEAHLRIKSMLTELRVLAMCRFPNILALYGVSVDNMSTPCIVYEFMPGGSLDDRLKRKQNYTSMPPLTWRQRASIARGTARGLNYLHTVKENHPLVHGDVKPANILLDGNLLPKLGDFGLTREGPEGECTHRDVSRLQGTKLYLPHEYLQSRHLSTKVDVYSFGLVLLELATNLKLYDEARSHRFLSSHVNALKIVGRHLEAKDPTGGDEPGANDLVDLFIKIGLKCCADQKKYRPEMAEVVEALKEATSAFKSLQPITTEPLATMQQHFTGVAGWLSPGNAALAAPQNSPRLSPSDNLQVGPSSPLPPAGTTPPMGTSNTQNFQQQQQLTRHHLMQQQLQKLQNTPYQPLLPQQQQKPLFHQGHLQKTQVPQQYI
ncbi:serine/threonine-protein kinase pelle-like, partial [Tropilaelaps mercedesae]